MTMQTATENRPKQNLTVEQKIQKLRELYGHNDHHCWSAGCPILSDRL